MAGYFETVLYTPNVGIRVELSTNPVTMDAKSAGMISWFPIYFPLKTPIHAPDNSEIVVHMWRQTDERKVWYEWMVEVFASAGDIADGKGKSRDTGKTRKKRIRLAGSELHSSIKEACLM